MPEIEYLWLVMTKSVLVVRLMLLNDDDAYEVDAIYSYPLRLDDALDVRPDVNAHNYVNDDDWMAIGLVQVSVLFQVIHTLNHQDLMVHCPCHDVAMRGQHLNIHLIKLNHFQLVHHASLFAYDPLKIK